MQATNHDILYNRQGPHVDKITIQKNTHHLANLLYYKVAAAFMAASSRRTSKHCYPG